MSSHDPKSGYSFLTFLSLFSSIVSARRPQGGNGGGPGMGSAPGAGDGEGGEGDMQPEM